ncbi:MULTISPECIES: FAD-dependent oxidoreductase [Nocardioides]|uniref:ferredoxin--NADP(+) reductase n=1 Tax=Nocardioides vastitatis TaxID=2568655 RepID=A0ABW0ZLY8_9ACTN|nr:FAD-dependent oxidoreductase [Nocardioides sp.]THI96758.1 4Fe-4S dicluster domain-containing protein [Nocardioides sp.]
MTYVITQSCCNDAACVPACPVNCIHPTPDEPDYATAEMLYIDPDSCIDCGACVDACPVNAISADYDLPDQLLRFTDLNAAYFRDPAHQGYPSSPPRSQARRWDGDRTEPLRVAIVGSGPAACYAAEELLTQRGLTVEVDMFERLMTPWGLVRFGVAPDHATTKQASDAFARTMQRKNFRLFLGVEIGTHLTHDDLAGRYHAVIYAVGAMTDRRLGIPGEDLPGSHSATELVAWYNGHPDFADRTFDFSGERAVVIGNGNVALDVARILLSDVEALRRTDIADHALEALSASNVREVLVVGRRGPAQAAFTTPELWGLDDTGLGLRVSADEVELDPVTRAVMPDEHAMAMIKAAHISALPTEGPTDRTVILRFLRSPVEIVGDGAVSGVRLVRNDLVPDDGRGVTAIATDDVELVECGLVFRSVGYRGRRVEGLPFDDDRGTLPNLDGRVVDPDTAQPVPGVYTAGWIKRGPSGVIGTNKKDAVDTVRVLLDDWVAGTLRADSAQDLAELLPDNPGLAGWKAIDHYERAAGREQARPRMKVVDHEALRELAAGALSTT